MSGGPLRTITEEQDVKTFTPAHEQVGTEKGMQWTRVSLFPYDVRLLYASAFRCRRFSMAHGFGGGGYGQWRPDTFVTCL